MSVKRSEIHGAKWWKVDFHNHTPASFDYGKGSNQSSLNNITPNQWLLDYMSKEIDCVIISDHNSGEWIDILKSELKIMESTRPTGFREIFLFPGIELSVCGGFHLLAIFDLNATTADLDKLLGYAEFQGERGKSDGVTTKSCEAIIEKIYNLGGIAIPAHVNLDGSGLFKKESGNTLKQILSVDGLLAIEVTDITLPKPAVYDHLKLNLAQVIGSDNHHPLGESQSRIGHSYTWVKMEKPSLEALKLALHDGSDGILRFDEITNDPNILGNRFYIKQIEVKNGNLAGRGQTPLRVDFSPWLSTVIGGRGTGKSSILNYLRLCLDQKADMPVPIQEEFDKFCKVAMNRGDIGMLKPDTKISVTILKVGRLIRIDWDHADNSFTEFELGTTGNWVSIGNITNISDLYRVNIFNQKELYELTKEPTALLDIIDRQFDLNTLNEQKDELVQLWLYQRSELRKIQNKITEESNVKAEIAQINAKLKIFEDAGNQEVFEGFKKGKKVSNKFDTHSTNLHNIESDLISLQSKFESNQLDIEVWEGIDAGSKQNVEQLQTEYSNILIDLKSLTSRFSSYRKLAEEDIPNLPWHEFFNGINENYRQLLASLSDPKSGATINHEELIQRNNILESRISEIESQKQSFNALKTESEETLDKIIDLEKQIRSNRRAIIKSANSKIVSVTENAAQDSPRLKIELRELGEINETEKTFRNLIRKDGITFAKDILRENKGSSSSGALHEICSADSEEARWANRDKFIEQLLNSSQSNPNDFDRRFIAHIEELQSSTPEDIDRLLIWVPADQIVLKLVSGRGEKSIETGSAGQRTAGMLTLLMSLGDEPLIIDQPEDDLDSRLISDLVVEGFKKLKTNRQLIVVTHNPNVAVNACAENIVEMKMDSGQITSHIYGALQNRDSRHAVCEVMEGGKTALDNRYFRISKALS